MMSVLFDSSAGLEGFMRLHNDQQESAELERDFDNYAPLPPQIVMGEVTVFEDIESVLRRGRELLKP